MAKWQDWTVRQVVKFGTLAMHLVSCSWGALVAQTSRLSSVPVEAEFLKPPQAHTVAPGSTVFAKVTAEWKGQGCILHTGAVLEGTVEAEEPRKNHNRSTLALSFHSAQCDGTDLQPYPLVLVAAAAPPNDYVAVPEVDINSPRLRAHPGGEPNASPDQPRFQTLGQHLEFTGVAHHFPFKPGLRPGDILGIRALKLEIGTGPNRSSVFSSEHKEVSLKAFTQILLNPPSVAFVRVAVPLPKAGAPKLTAPATRAALAAMPIDTLEVCKAPACVIDRPVSPADFSNQASGSISLVSLGFRPRSRRLLADFEQDVALAWLGPDQLLFAFNSHPLVPRGKASPETARMVHAVLLNSSSQRVLHSADWKIPDAERFLWQLDATRVLVEDELRVYSTGLQLERTIPLGGKLRFLRISPNGNAIMAGTLRERHSHDLHSHLREVLGSEPEEDVDISIFDRDFQIVSSGVAASTLAPPALLNEGQVSLRPQAEGDYRMAIARDQSTTATLARFRSTCGPEVSSIAPDLLFLISCATNIGESEYRVLHADGTLMLRGRPGLHQAGIESAADARRFAVKLVSRLGNAPPGSPFSASDLDFAEIRIYRAEDGKRLAAVRVDDPPTTYGAFALSPDGSQLAALSGSRINIFTLPAD